MIVGKGMVDVKLGANATVEVEAFHAPEFSSNILAANLLSEHF